jgi:hypothetical protein
MAWSEIGLNKGLALTRPPHLLADGELARAEGVRYAQGDPDRVRRDTGWNLHSDVFVDGDPILIRSMGRLSFEESEDKLLLYGRKDRRLGFFTNSASKDTDDDWEQKVDIGFPDGQAISLNHAEIHLGNQYFIGANLDYNFIVDEDNEWQRMGMQSAEEAGLTEEVVTTNVNGDEDTLKRMYGDVWDYVDLGTANHGSDVDPDFVANQTMMLYFISEYDADLDVESDPYYAGALIWDEDINWDGYDWLDDWQDRNQVKLFGRKVTGTVQIRGLGQTMELASAPKFDVSSYTKINPRATHIRVYRHYINPDTSTATTFLWNHHTTGVQYNLTGLSAKIRELWKFLFTATRSNAEHGGSALVGSLVLEVDLDAGTSTTGGQDTSDKFRTLSDPTDNIFEYHIQGGTFIRTTPPKPFSIGIALGDQLLVNSPTEGMNLMRYSLSGFPEYFPNSNILGIATEDNDDILAMLKMETFGLILTRSGSHRVDYLPGPADVQDPLRRVGTDGIVGKKAAEVITMPQGLVGVWLGHDSLYMSTGAGSFNACLDFGVEDADLVETSKAILANNRLHRRLELTCTKAGDIKPNTRVLHFYYSREHLKPGGFKLTGFHRTPDEDEVVGVANEPSINAPAPLWTASSSSVYSHNSYTDNLPDMAVDIATFSAGAVGRVSILNASLYHGPVSGDLNPETGLPFERVRLSVNQHTYGYPRSGEKYVTFPSHLDFQADKMAVTGVSANEVTPGLRYSGGGPMEWGPFHLDIEASPDGS